MTMSRGESPLWLRVLILSEAMDDSGLSTEQLIGYLRGLDEGFSATTDPVEQFPEFATLRLCRSVHRLLEQSMAQAPD